MPECPVRFSLFSMPVAVLVQPRFANTFRNRLPFSHDLPDKRHRIAEIAGLNINDHLPVLQWSFAYPSYKNEGNGQSTCDAIPRLKQDRQMIPFFISSQAAARFPEG